MLVAKPIPLATCSRYIDVDNAFCEGSLSFLNASFIRKPTTSSNSNSHHRRDPLQLSMRVHAPGELFHSETLGSHRLGTLNLPMNI